MVITFVMDQYGETSNGTSSTAMRFAHVLRQKGHEVRILTASDIKGDDIYTLPEYRLPVFQYIIDRNGMKFALPDEKILHSAIEGSDVVHMLMPFRAQKAAYEVAEKLHVATTAAFHLQPENITYNIKLNKLKPLNVIMYKKFKKFFDCFGHVHCPSEMLEVLLNKYRYRSHKHVISNGIDPAFRKKEDAVRPAAWEDKYVIVMSGRLAREKRQDVLIRAIAASKYKDKIRLVLCGKGHWQKKVEKLGNKLLPDAMEIKFCTKEELIDILSCADLYVHASEVELEAISCMEAFACGLVPVIADAKMSATKQFALTEHNLFHAGNVRDLTEKIDWYIEHPEEKAALAARYTEYAREFAIDACVDRMIEEMFVTAVQENKEKWANVEREQAYVQGLTVKDRKKYFAAKKKYEKACDKRGAHDYLQSYITCVEK